MQTYIRSIIKILVITLAATALVALIGLIFRWQTAVQFSDGFFWVGMALAGAGILGSFGDKDIRMGSGSRFFWSSPQERQTRLAGVEDPRESARRASLTTGKGFGSYVLLFISAALIIVIGYLVTVLF